MARGLLQAEDPLAHLFSPAFRTQLLSHALVLLAFLLLAYAWGSISPRFSPLSQKRHSRPERWERVARIDELWVYPVKSCKGTRLDTADVTRQGWEFDRRWIVWDVTRERSISLREEPRLALIAPSLDFASEQLHLRYSDSQSTLSVPLQPSSATLASWAPLHVPMYGDGGTGRIVPHAGTWLTAQLGYACHLLQFDPVGEQRAAFPLFRKPNDWDSWARERREELESRRGIEFQDEYPFLVATQESLGALRTQLSDAVRSDTDGIGGAPIRNLDRVKWAARLDDTDTQLSMQRFRPNIVLSSLGAARFNAYDEDDWDQLRIVRGASAVPVDGHPPSGRTSIVLHLIARCQRCLLTSVDPATAERDVQVPLALLRRSRMRQKTPGKRDGPCFGVYAVPESTGDVHVGDEVWVRWREAENETGK